MADAGQEATDDDVVQKGCRLRRRSKWVPTATPFKMGADCDAGYTRA